MVGVSDYVGIGTLITATAAAIVSVIVAWRQTETKAAVHDIQHQVATPDDTTLGEIVAGIDPAGNTPPSTPKVEP